MFERRLNKSRKDALDIPKLPKGYYWVLRETKPPYSNQIEIRKRRFCGWKDIEKTASYGIIPPGDKASREKYQTSINSLYEIFNWRYEREQEVDEAWQSWASTGKTVEDEVAAVLSSRANIEKTAIRYG